MNDNNTSCSLINICRCSLNNDRCVLECFDFNKCKVFNKNVGPTSVLNENVGSTLNVSSTLDVGSTLDVSSTLDPDLTSEPIFDNLLPCNIEIPQFNAKININNEDELSSSAIVEDDLSLYYSSPPKNLSYEEMQNVMSNIEDTINFTSASDGMHALNNPDILVSRIQYAFDIFKEKTGRQMTYSEMRYMMG
jgi:hypothetical protein